MSQFIGKMQRPQVLRRARVTSDSSFCGYTHRVCMQPRLEGYEYCTRHILEDKNSPFKQCQYTSSKTGKRCSCAAVKGDRKEGYCADHARRAAHIRMYISRKRRQKECPETLIEDLEHYTRKNNGATDKKNKMAESAAAKIMDYASSSDSDVDGLTVEHMWRGDCDSDAESVDSEQEDPLKHAGVYTAEEVALITRDKLIRLQSLYIDQFKRLQHVMKEKKRRYVHKVRKEREALGSIHYAKHDPRERSKYEGLVAMRRYHRRYGQEALLHRQSKERRIAVSEGPSNYRPPSYPKCIHSKNGGKCGARTIPLSKYCQEHILADPHQVLYRTCAFAGSCARPVAGILDNSACLYHHELEDIDHRLPSKKEEKDESKDEIDVVGGPDSDVKPDQSLQLQQQLEQQERSEMRSGGDRAESGEPESQTPSFNGKPIQLDLNKARDVLRPIAPMPSSKNSSQLSPTKPTQVPLVVNDLLAEEKLVRKPADPGKRRQHPAQNNDNSPWKISDDVGKPTQGPSPSRSGTGGLLPMMVEDEQVSSREGRESPELDEGSAKTGAEGDDTDKICEKSSRVDDENKVEAMDTS